MAEVTVMAIKVDLQCRRCYLKIKKVLCELPEIRDQICDKKLNLVLITVLDCSPERIRDKIIRKGRQTVKSVEILPDNSSDGNDEQEVRENPPVRPLSREDSSDGDDEKVSKERTSPRKDDSDPLFSTSVEDEESDDKDDVGNTPPTHGSCRRRITSWEKGDLLGSGSFGAVYKATADDGFSFAVKEVSLLDQGSLGRQSQLQPEQEISVLSQLKHKNIVQYLGTQKDGKKLYIFLELMSEGSLATLYQGRKLRDSEVSVYTRQILNGLKYLHDQKVVHRDIKCANILVDVSGTVKLADFGLAKVIEMNAATSLVGSSFWIAPEVVNLEERSSQSNRSYGLKVDIWSLGCTVLEMLTRQHPYPEFDQWQALFRIGMGNLPEVPQSLSSDAQDFILKCLRKNPEDRPSAAQLLDHPFVRKPPTASGFASPLFND